MGSRKAPDPAAGWYPDPVGRDVQRWWDGSAWTDEVQTRGTYRRQRPLPRGTRCLPPAPHEPSDADHASAPSWGQMLIGVTLLVIAAWLLSAWGQGITP